MTSVDLVNRCELVDVGVKDGCLDGWLIEEPEASRTAAKFIKACSVCSAIPSASTPDWGSIPTVPEQKTKPPATIA